MNKPKKSNEVEYSKRKCLLCDKVHVKSLYISMREHWFFICLPCHKELKDAL